MSTRATYLIEGVCFYVHHDGYPEGAAAKFAAAITLPGRHAGLAERFIRANDNAEFTAGHEDDSDHDHQYTVTGTRIAHRARTEENAWRVAYCGDLAAWLNTYTDGEFVICGGRVRAVSDVIKDADRALNEALRCTQHGWSGNASGHIGDAWRMVSALPQGCDARARVLRAMAGDANSIWRDQYGDDAPRRWVDAFAAGATAEEKSAALAATLP